MALPNQFKAARMTDATFGNTIDDQMGNLEKAACDIFGMPIDTNIAAALFEVVAAGLKKVILQNAAADPAAVGELLRNAGLLKFHDGSAVQRLAFYADFSALLASTSNAFGTRTVSTSAPSGGADGDIWLQY